MSGRKTVEVTITREGRDKGKVYILTELPASQVERWALRAFFAMNRAGIEVPPEVQGSGIAGVAMMGFKTFASVRFEDAEPLFDEMFRCVQIRPDPDNLNVIRNLVESDIEEVVTRLQLRAEIFALHTGFSVADILSKLMSAAIPKI